MDAKSQSTTPPFGRSICSAEPTDKFMGIALVTATSMKNNNTDTAPDADAGHQEQEPLLSFSRLVLNPKPHTTVNLPRLQSRGITGRHSGALDLRGCLVFALRCFLLKGHLLQFGFGDLWIGAWAGRRP